MRARKLKKDVMDTDSLILFYLESLEKSEKKEFTYNDLIYKITHVYKIKTEFSKSIVDDLIRLGFFDVTIKDGEQLYAKNFEAEKSLVFKVNMKKLKEFARNLNIKMMNIRKGLINVKKNKEDKFLIKSYEKNAF